MMFSRKMTKTIIAVITAFAMMGSVAVIESARATDVYAAGSVPKIASGSSINPGSNNITVENCEKGKQYIVSVVKGSYNKYSVSADSIKYINQKKAPTGGSVDFSFNINETDRVVVLLSSNDEKADYPIVIGEVNVPIVETQILFADRTYNGRTQYAGLAKASYRDSDMTANTDLTYSGRGVNVGRYSVAISGKGRFVGATTRTFNINPVGTRVTKVSRAKKALTAKWSRPAKKYKKQITGYQIQYSLYPNFSYAKTTTAKYKSKSKKIKGLAKKRRYYVRIRTYKNGCYSGWSAAKSAVTK